MNKEHFDPGHYDDEAERILREQHAFMVGLIVVHGDRGHGFSVAIGCENEQLGRAHADKIPALLRNIADSIEKGYEVQRHSRTWADINRKKGKSNDPQQ